jgi:hypothetical protein
MTISSVKTGAVGLSLALDNNYMEPIATTLVGSGGTSIITFSDIPQTYKHLQLRCLAKATTTVNATSNAFVRFNGDNGSNYTYHYLRGDGSSASSIAGTSQTSNLINDATVGSNASFANMFGVYIIDVLDYANTSKNKTIRILSGADLNNLGSVQMGLGSGLWIDTTAISSIQLTCSSNFAQYSRFSLYGIKG